MSVGLLTDAQVATLKTFRAKAWTRTFTIRTYPTQTVTDLYDDPSGSYTDVTPAPLGDWTWKPHMGEAGTPGGALQEGALFLCTNLAYSGTLMDPRTRLIVEGRYVAPKRILEAADFGEIVVEGVIVHG